MASSTEALGHKVLLAGRPGFWQEPLQRLFAKEGWDFYVMTEDFLEPREIFRVENLPIIIYALGRTRMGEDEGQWLSEMNELLALAYKYGVEHFFLISSLRALPREGETEPCSHSAALAESVLNAWQQMSGLKASIIRLPDLYGEGQTPEQGFSAEMLQAAEGEGTHKGWCDPGGLRDFLYVDDAVYGIFRAVSRRYEGEPLNLLSGHPVTAGDFVQAVGEAVGKPLAIAEGDEIFARPVPDAKIAQLELGWQPRYQLPEGLKLTCRGNREAAEAAEKARLEAGRKEKSKRLKEQLIPYGENLAGAFLMAIIAAWQGGSPVNSWTYFDVNYVYICVMGLLYGKRQAMIAASLSAVILLAGLLNEGLNAVALMYMPGHLLHFITYLFVAVATGYFADGRRYEREAAQWQARQAQIRYDFLRSLYDENVAVKDRLYRQIVNSDDSIGRLYNIIRRLDSVQPENIFTQAASVTAQVLNVEDIVVYVLGRDGYYLRQKVRMGRLAAGRPRSLRIDDHGYLRNLIAEKSIYMNRELVKDTPDIAAPIVFEDKVIAVVEVFGLSFEQWSLYQQNLLSITIRLIASSMGRAYQYEAEVQERHYYPGTRVMKEAAFRDIIEDLRARRRLQGDLPVSVLRAVEENLDYQDFDKRCGRMIRNEDFVGELNGKLYILLPDANLQVQERVRERLGQAGFAAEADGTVI